MGRPKKLKEEKSPATESYKEAPKYTTREPHEINNEYSQVCAKLGDLVLSKDRVCHARDASEEAFLEQFNKIEHEQDIIRAKVKELSEEMAKSNGERASK